MVSARDEVLLYALVDWIPLDSIHRIVARTQPNASTAEIQSQVLQIIESLAADGLVALGNLNPEPCFVSWDIPLIPAMQRLRDVYVDGFADKNKWPWFCWLDLTENGTRVAESIEATLQNDQR